MGKLDGRIALITGGGSGIGKAIALEYAGEGAIVVVCGRSKDKLLGTASEISAMGAKCEIIEGDIGNEEDVISIISEIVRRLGRIDILVNNASIVGQVGPVVEVDLAQWEESLRVNLTGSVICSREAVKYMIKQNSGNIINISSMVARGPFKNRAAYNCCKVAMIGFSQTLAKEVAEYGIRVNSLLTGVVMTERLKGSIVKHAEALQKPTEDLINEWKAWSPMNRFVEPEECAKVALFLASDDSSAMTGQALNVTAGVIMT